MEYIEGPSLFAYIKNKNPRRLSEDDARNIFINLLNGLNYCHKHAICHRDIKLENILIDRKIKRAKFIDFGFSTNFPIDKKVKMFCGTPSYMAPEIVARTEYAGGPADIWAMGVLLFAMLTGKFPFKGTTDKEVYANI